MPPVITNSPKGTTVIQAKTKVGENSVSSKRAFQWWNASDKADLLKKLFSTIYYIKDNQTYRYRQASLYSAMYGNLPLSGWVGTSFTKMVPNSLPQDRPTMSVVTSCIDTVVAKLAVSDPRPVFLTEAGDYRYRHLGQDMTKFIKGVFYETDAYDLGKMTLRDAGVLGTGIIKILESPDKKVTLERRLSPELLVDNNDGFYGKPRCFYELKLVDRNYLLGNYKKNKDAIERAWEGYPDNTGDSSRTVSDMIVVAEAWRLPSHKDAGDGMHVLACSEGILKEEVYEKDYFPFAFLHYAPRLYGFWGQGIAERQMGTQSEINKILITISRSINLVGVPRIFVDESSKIGAAAFDNNIGSIIKYRGIKPIYEVAPCVPKEMYEQLQRLINFAYQQEGISELTAQAEKPAGLDSGEAIRTYNNIQTVRFSTVESRYNDLYIDLAYKVIDLAKDIAERDGKYSAVYPTEDGVQKIDLPSAKLLSNVYEIQCYEESSLPDDPAGRIQTVSEWADKGWIDVPEAKRLLNFPDLKQDVQLETAGKERILKILDEIVHDGKYSPPDPFMSYPLAIQSAVQYYNLYITKNLETKKQQLLIDFYNQAMGLMKASQPPSQPMAAGQPGAPPQAPPNAQAGMPMQPGMPESSQGVLPNSI